MNLGLQGKIAFVGGASSGLGEAIAKSLAAEGASLALAARRADELGRVADEIQGTTGADVLAIQADFTRPDDLARAVAETVARYGHADILVTNTGGPPSMPFTGTTDAMWESACRLLLMSAVALARGFLPGMAERRWGRIVCITSIAVKQPVENIILSNSVRSAVTGFAKTLSNEVAPDNITVNCVLPGYTKTQRVEYLARKTMELERIGYDDAIKKWTNQIPMGRMAEPGEVADLVSFLASEKASYITGQSIAVDGGWIRNLL